MVVLFSAQSGRVHHLMWCLTMCIADYVDNFYISAEMDNKECTEMQLKFQDWPNPSVFITIPTVGGTHLHLTAANNAVITQKFWVLNKQCQVFGQIIWLGQNRIPQKWLLNTGLSSYNHRVSDLHQLSGVALMRVGHGLMSWQNSITSTIDRILEDCADHMKQLRVEEDVVPSVGKDKQ